MANKIFQLINKNLALINFFNPSEKKALPIITISREMGAGGKPIAYLIAQKLGKKWRVYHKDLIDKIAKKAHLEKELIKEIDEKNMPVIDKIVGDFFGKRYPSLAVYYKNLVKVLAEISQRGYAIIIGRGANFLLPQALNVRIIASMEQRIQWEMEFEKITRKEAIRRITNSDKQRLQFIQSLYQHDLRKAHHYDLIIRTGKNLPIDLAADLIIQAAKKRFKI